MIACPSLITSLIDVWKSIKTNHLFKDTVDPNWVSNGTCVRFTHVDNLDARGQTFKPAYFVNIGLSATHIKFLLIGFLNSDENFVDSPEN